MYPLLPALIWLHLQHDSWYLVTATFQRLSLPAGATVDYVL